MAHDSTPEVVVLDEADLAERQSIINAACSLFIKFGFHQEMFGIKNIHENGYTDKEILQLCKPLFLMHDREKLTSLFESIPKNDLGKFLERMEYLNTKEGRRSISDAFMKISKNQEEMAEEDVALAHKLVASAAAQRITHKNILEQISDLAWRKLLLEEECLQIEEELNRKLGPLYQYQEPSTHELRLQAYKLYEIDCRSKKIPAYPIHHHKGFEIATKTFGAVAKNLHLLSYLNHDTIRRESIQKHLKEYYYFADEKKKKKKEEEDYCGDSPSSGHGETDPAGSSVPISAELVNEEEEEEEEEAPSPRNPASDHVCKVVSPEKSPDSNRKRPLTNLSDDEPQPKRAPSGN